MNMITIHLILHSYLREKLPAEARGRADLPLPEGSRVADVFASLGIAGGVAWSLNGKLERDTSLALNDGDELRVFRQGSGGA